MRDIEECSVADRDEEKKQAVSATKISLSHPCRRKVGTCKYGDNYFSFEFEHPTTKLRKTERAMR